MTAIIIGGWAAFILITPAPPPDPPSLIGYVSAYSCDAHPSNSMHPCGLFRDGSTPHDGLHGLVAACPLERMGQSVWVQGWGVLRCVDTPRTEYVDGMAHIDAFTALPQAWEWGVQEVPIEWIVPVVGQEAKDGLERHSG